MASNATELAESVQTRGEKAAPEMLELRQHLDSMLLGMRIDRFSFWTHWRELADYILPRRYKWLITPNQGNRGSPINQRIIDSTATVAFRVLASGMMAGVTSPSRPWYRLSTGNDLLDENAEVKQFLAEARDRMLRIMSESNYYNAKAVQYQDLSVFGSAPFFIAEDDEDCIRCYNYAAGEYYLANSSRMSVDTVYREFVLTTRQVADQFGLENCSETVKAAMRTGGAQLTKEIVVAHAIEPNTSWRPGSFGIKGMKYREVYWEWGSGQNLVLKIGGFHEWPMSSPRWDIVGNDAYGRSPAMDALGDIKQLQVMTKREAQAIDKMVNPPLLADAQLKNEPATTLPGGITYLVNSANSAGMKPIYEVKPDLQHFVASKQEVQKRIKDVAFNDLFLMISELDTVRTATEIDARKEEKLIQLGPVLERFENEALDPEIDRIFSIMMRRGLMPPVPKVLSGLALKVEYVSMLAQSQKAASTAALERLLAFVGNIAAAKPDAIDNIDTDEAIDQYADMLGVSPKIVLASQKLAALRQQRAQQQQVEQALQQSMAAAQGAKTLSETNVGGGANALQHVLGNV